MSYSSHSCLGAISSLTSTSPTSSAAATVIDLPFPQNIPEIPPNVENTDSLPSSSLLSNFANATKLMQPHFEQELEKLPPISFVVSDGFLGWTLASASKFGVPRLALFGWNSCLESICEFVPILAWPLMNDQHLNARFVVEEIKIRLRVETCNASVRGFVKWERLVKMMRELMEGERGEMVRFKVKEVGKKAWMAMEDGGSSQQTLDQLLAHLCNRNQV